jgi:translation initiation factor 2 alpha subunit (eIF-2alpha)
MEKIKDINYYSTKDPCVNELVIVKITRQTDAFFGDLIEYLDYTCIMNYQDVVKKRKVKSWSKFVPLNKLLVVNVDEVDINKKIVQVSMAYLADMFDKEITENQIQEKLIEKFNENKILESFITSLCFVNKLDFKKIWISLVYHIDTMRRKHDDEPLKSLWQYFSDNIDEIMLSCELDDIIKILIKELYNKRTKEIFKKIITKIKIISIDGIDIIKEHIFKILNNVKYKYNFYYDTTPYYIFETTTEDSTIESHHDFIKELENKNSNIFIKIEYIGKI